MFTPRATQSLCPVCLKLLDAVYEEFPPQSGEIIMRKTCPEHGEFMTPVWRGGPSLIGWNRPKTPSFPACPQVGRTQDALLTAAFVPIMPSIPVPGRSR